MPYATPADLRARYPEPDLQALSDVEGEVINDAPLERALADASAEIDAYLQGRYPLPLAVVPALLVQVACEIAFYNLLRTRPTAAVEDARERYKSRVRYLEQVAAGRVSLGLSAADDEVGPATAPTESAVVLMEGPPRLFSGGSMAGL